MGLEEREHPFRKERFDVRDLQDEIRVDALCGRLLEVFYRSLIEERRLPAEEAGALAHGADYFLREFLIPDRKENIFAPSPGRIRQFAGNWYIVRNLEPNMVELEDLLKGVEAFYDWGMRTGQVDAATSAEVARDCRDLGYYRGRIESFWAIEGDGYFAWEKECSLRDPNRSGAED